MLGRLFAAPQVEERDLSYQQVWGSGLDVSTMTTWSGAFVNQANSLQLGAVYACVRLLGDTISALPTDTFVRVNGDRQPYRPRPAWVTEPDGPGSSRIDYMQQVVTSMLLSHGAVIQVLRGGNGEVVALVPLDPTRVEVRRNPGSRQREFVIDGGTAVLPQSDVLYITEMRRPGQLKGVSRVDEVKQTLGLAKALDEFAARYFSNGANTSGIIEFPGNLTREQAKDLVSGFEEGHKGLRRSHRPGVLFGGAKFTKTTVDNDSAQFLESRRFAVEEIARIFRVPPSMLGVTTPGAMSYASVEQNGIQYVTHTLRPYIEKIEEGYSRLLEGRAFMKFNVDGLLRGDQASRYASFSTGIQSGFLSINDIHRLEDMSPVEGGDSYRVPLANVDINAANLAEMQSKAEIAQRLILAGFDPAEVLAQVGLPAIAHTGLPSSQLQQISTVAPQDPKSAYEVQ